MSTNNRYASEVKGRLAKEDCHDQLTQQLQFVWQRPALSHLVESCPEYIRQLIADCSSFLGPNRPSFTRISVQLAAGPMQEFSQTLHNGQRRLTSKSLRPRFLSSATSLLSSAVSAVRLSIGRVRKRTRSEAHVVRPVRSGASAEGTEPKALTFATEPTGGALSSSTNASTELPQIRSHSLTAPAAVKAGAGPSSVRCDPLDGTADHLIEPNGDFDVGEQHHADGDRRRTPCCHTRYDLNVGCCACAPGGRPSSRRHGAC